MVKFLILILNKSYFLTLRNNALIFVFFVIVMLELRGIVECGSGAERPLNQGVAMSVGGPLAGSIYDSLGSYDWCFYFAGGSSALAGAFFLLSLIIVKRVNLGSRKS